jgi:uncharacterized membrane protein
MKNKKEQTDVIPIPWDYNPSSWKQRVKISLIAVIAAGIAFYMGLYQWGLIDDVWDPIFGDQTKQVLRSDVSHTMSAWFRVPDAILGFVAYLGDVIFALAGSARRWQYRPWLVVLFGLDVIPLGIVGAILVFLQGTIVGSWCFLCIVSAIISLILVVMAYDEVFSTLIFLYRLWKKTKSKKIIWKTFWGSPSEEAYEVGLTMVKE